MVLHLYFNVLLYQLVENISEFVNGIIRLTTFNMLLINTYYNEKITDKCNLFNVCYFSVFSRRHCRR